MFDKEIMAKALEFQFRSLYYWDWETVFEGSSGHGRED